MGFLSILASAPGALAVEALEDWFSFSAHLRAVAGATTGDYEELAVHGHDPNQDFTLQGLEMGVNIRPNEFIQAFAGVNVFLDTADELDAEWEEGFLKLANLPGGFELRGGRYLNRFGTQNNVHLHGWDFVDANLVTATFLGEEGLISEAGELTWIFEQGQFLSAISASFGNAVTHEHDHGHEEDEDEEEEEGEEEEHEHGAEEAYFADEVLTVRWMGRWSPNDFHQHQVGVNFGQGDNGYGRNSTVWSGDYTYQWRENGLEAGGRSLRVIAEAYHREVEWMHDEMGMIESGETGHWGTVLSILYGFGDGWEAGARVGWLEGAAGVADETIFEVEERTRISAVLSKRVSLGDDTTGIVRLQLNHDDFDHGDDQSVALQFGFDWGGPEVR